MSSKVRLLSLFVFAVAMSVPGLAYSYTVVSTTTTTIGTFEETTTVVSASSDPIDRFSYTRVRKTTATFQGSILILPPLLSNFSTYKIPAPSGNYKDTFAGIFAKEGYEVYGFSPRTTNLSSGDCDGAVDCSVMDGWGLSTWIDDITYIRNAIDDDHPGENPVIGGISLGTMMAIAVVDAHPGDYAGLLMWEGTLYAADPDVQAIMTGFCAEDDVELLAGHAWNDGLYNALATAHSAGHRAWVTLLSSPNPRLGGIATFTIAAGNPVTDTFTFADDTRLEHLLLDGNVYEATRVLRDVDCAYAGETTFNGNLGSFTAPILAIEAERGFGDHMDEIFPLFGTSSSDIDVSFNNDMGHADTYMSLDHTDFSEDVIMDWLDNTIFP